MGRGRGSGRRERRRMAWKVRFTQKDGAVYAFLLGEPKGKTVTIRDLTVKQRCEGDGAGSGGKCEHGSRRAGMWRWRCRGVCRGSMRMG